MSAELQPNAELEIAHVLFIDVVGYSRLLINEQSALLAELNQLVRTTPHFRTAEAAGKLIRIPIGDGMALVFFTSPEAPVQCAPAGLIGGKASGRRPLRIKKKPPSWTREI